MNTSTDLPPPPGSEATVLRQNQQIAETVMRLEAAETEPQVVIVPPHQGAPPSRQSPPRPHMTQYAYRLLCRAVHKQIKNQRRFAGQSPEDRADKLAAAAAKRARKAERRGL